MRIALAGIDWRTMICSLKPRFTVLALAALSVASLGTTPAAAMQAPDNTAVNKGDSSAPTADKAKNDTTDRELMRHIRHDLVRDKSLSTYGHNVKVVAVDGKVTLRGPVRSDDEKKAIEEHATKYAGAGNVTNELTVKGS
jgi:hyperosmotically inducible protein